MPSFRHVSEPDPSAATVHLFKSGPNTMARIAWPDRGKAKWLIGSSVGRELQPAVAMSMIGDALAYETVDTAVVQLDDPALWNEAWGKLV